MSGALPLPDGVDMETATNILNSCDTTFRSNLAQQSRIASPGAGAAGEGNGDASGGGNGSGFKSFARPGGKNAVTASANSDGATAPGGDPPAGSSGNAADTTTNTNDSGSDANADAESANRLVNPLPVNPDDPADPPTNNNSDDQASANPPAADTPATDPPAAAPPTNPNPAANTNSNTNSGTAPGYRSFGPNAAPHSSDPARERFGGSAAARTGAARGGAGPGAFGLNEIGGMPTTNLLSTANGLTGVTGNFGTATSPLSLIGGLPVGGIPGNLGSVADAANPVSLIGGGLPNLPGLPGVPNNLPGLPTGAVPGFNSFEQFAPSQGATDGIEDGAAGGVTNLGNSAAPCEGGDVNVCSDTTTEA